MNRLFIAVLISLSTLLFACDGESSSNGGGGSAGSIPSGGTGAGSIPNSNAGGASADPSDEIDTRNEGIQEGLNTGSGLDSSTSIDTDIEPTTEPIDLEPIENEDEDGLDSLNTLDN